MNQRFDIQQMRKRIENRRQKNRQNLPGRDVNNLNSGRSTATNWWQHNNTTTPSSTRQQNRDATASERNDNNIRFSKPTFSGGRYDGYEADQEQEQDSTTQTRKDRASRRRNQVSLFQDDQSVASVGSLNELEKNNTLFGDAKDYLQDRERQEEDAQRIYEGVSSFVKNWGQENDRSRQKYGERFGSLGETYAQARRGINLGVTLAQETGAGFLSIVKGINDISASGSKKIWGDKFAMSEKDRELFSYIDEDNRKEIEKKIFGREVNSAADVIDTTNEFAADRGYNTAEKAGLGAAAFLGTVWLDSPASGPLSSGKRLFNTGKSEYSNIANQWKNEVSDISNERLIQQGLESWRVDGNVANAYKKVLAEETDPETTRLLLQDVFKTSDEVRAIERNSDDFKETVLRAGDDDIEESINAFSRRSGADINESVVTQTANNIRKARQENPNTARAGESEIDNLLNRLSQSRYQETADATRRRIQESQRDIADINDVDELIEAQTPRSQVRTKSMIEEGRRNSNNQVIRNAQNKIDELDTEASIILESARNHPGRDLIRFASKRAATTNNGGNGLPEITGKPGPNATEFSRTGDEILANLGIESREQANDYLDQYRELRESLENINEQVREQRDIIRDENAANQITAQQEVAASAEYLRRSGDESVLQNTEDIQKTMDSAGETIDFKMGDVDPNKIRSYQMWKNQAHQQLNRLLANFDDNTQALKVFLQQNKDAIKTGGSEDPWKRLVRMTGMKKARFSDVEIWGENFKSEVFSLARKNDINTSEMHQTVHDYLLARHIPERNGKLGEQATPISTAAAEQTRKYIEALPYADDVLRLADDLKKFHDDTLDLAIEGELIDDRTFRSFKSTYKNHVPLNRVFEDDEIFNQMLPGGSLDVSSTGFYAAKGSKRDISDLFVNITEMRKQTIERAMSNLANKNSVKFMEDNKSFGIFKKLSQRDVQKLSKQEMDNYVITYFDQGKKSYMQISDPELAAVFKYNNIRSVQPGVVQFAGGMTRFLSNMFTRYNPAFGVVNPIRDMQEAAVWLDSINESGVARKFSLNQKRSVSGIRDWFNGKDTEWGRLYEDMRANGGTSGGVRYYDESELQKMRTDNTKLYDQNAFKRQGKRVFDFVDRFNTIAEDATRLSVYKAALDEGQSKEAAAFLAKKSTIDFDQMGRLSPEMNALYMFAKVGTVGSIKAIRSLSNPKTLAKTTGIIGLGVYQINEMNDALYPDWRNLVTDYELESTQPIVIPTNDGKPVIVRIPVAYALRPIKRAADELHQITTGKRDSFAESAKGIGTSMIESFNPIGGSDIGSAAMPTALDVPFAVWRNQSWTGKTIFPDYNKDESDHLKYYDSQRDTTSGRITIKAASLLNNLTGMSVTPETMEYAFEQYTGGPGNFTSDIVDTLTAVGKGDTPELNSFPIINSFLRKRDPNEYSSISQIYDFADAINKNQADINHYKEIEAQDFVVELNTMTDEEYAKAWDQALLERPEMMKRVNNILEDERKGITGEDRMIKNMTVKNGDRARVIYYKLYEMNDENFENKWNEYINKGLITPTVDEQLQQLLQENPEPKDILKNKEREYMEQKKRTISTTLNMDPETGFVNEEEPIKKFAALGTVAAIGKATTPGKVAAGLWGLSLAGKAAYDKITKPEEAEASTDKGEPIETPPIPEGEKGAGYGDQYFEQRETEMQAQETEQTQEEAPVNEETETINTENAPNPSTSTDGGNDIARSVGNNPDSSFEQGILYSENRGAVRDPEQNVYESEGPTGDLGKYQVSPDTLADWSRPWLGKAYSKEEFLNDPVAQEKFFYEFQRMANARNLTDEEKAIAWHRGWGELGSNSDDKEKKFRENLKQRMQGDVAESYLEAFREGANGGWQN